jgi:hypothetical protein
MLDIYDELLNTAKLLEARGIEYALCGDMALAVYDLIRATVDIEMLIILKDVNQALAAAGEIGFDMKALPMTFAQGSIYIHRVSKIDMDMGQHLSLDFLAVKNDLSWLVSDRHRIELDEGAIWVASIPGLIHLKSLRGSAQDLEDIEMLRDYDESY